jgi:hypothetical protein
LQLDLCRAHLLTLFPGDVTAPTGLDNLVVGLVGDRRSAVVPVMFPDALQLDLCRAHLLTLFPGDVTALTGLDNLVVGLVGDRRSAVVPVMFPDAFFTVTTATRALVPLVYRSGPHAAGTANTDLLRARALMSMPSVLAGDALSNAPSEGRYSLVGFFNTFVQPYLTSADPLVNASVTLLANWWRLASTNNAGQNLIQNLIVSSTLTVVNIPHEQSLVQPTRH